MYNELVKKKFKTKNSLTNMDYSNLDGHCLKFPLKQVGTHNADWPEWILKITRDEKYNLLNNVTLRCILRKCTSSMFMLFLLRPFKKHCDVMMHVPYFLLRARGKHYDESVLPVTKKEGKGKGIRNISHRMKNGCANLWTVSPFPSPLSSSQTLV